MTPDSEEKMLAEVREHVCGDVSMKALICSSGPIYSRT